jgi:hypothetical protein
MVKSDPTTASVRQRQLVKPLFPSPLAPAFHPRHSRNRSGEFARRGKEDWVASGVGQHRQHRLGQSKDAGRILETAGSANDLKGQSTLGLIRREIDAIASFREIDLQQAPVKEPKQAGAGYIWKIELGGARTSAGRLRRSDAGLDQSKRERALRAVPGEILFPGICVGLL